MNGFNQVWMKNAAEKGGPEMNSNAAGQSYPVPLVRALIKNSAGQILLLRRALSRYGQEGWCLLGGKIDYGQTVEEALAQEI